MNYRSDEIKSMVSIDAVIQSYGIELKHNKCCCPFHNENTPSFSINTEKQIFKCFGCGVGGDVITFVQRYENVDFKEALKRLNDRFGLGLGDSKPINSDWQKQKQENEKAKMWVTETYQQLLYKYKTNQLSMKMIYIFDEFTSNNIKYLIDTYYKNKLARSEIDGYINSRY